MKKLQDAAIHILQQLTRLVGSLTHEQYKATLPTLSGQSIGKHTRHIIEFYSHLTDAYVHRARVINYDARPRDYALETQIPCAIQAMEKAIMHLDLIYTDRPIDLICMLDEYGAQQQVPTTFFRELVYNLEHTVHHLAIIRIAITAHFPEVQLAPELGVSYATLQYEQQKA